MAFIGSSNHYLYRSTLSNTTYKHMFFQISSELETTNPFLPLWDCSTLYSISDNTVKSQSFFCFLSFQLQLSLDRRSRQICRTCMTASPAIMNTPILRLWWDSMRSEFLVFASASKYAVDTRIGFEECFIEADKYTIHSIAPDFDLLKVALEN